MQCFLLQKRVFHGLRLAVFPREFCVDPGARCPAAAGGGTFRSGAQAASNDASGDAWTNSQGD